MYYARRWGSSTSSYICQLPLGLLKSGDIQYWIRAIVYCFTNHDELDLPWLCVFLFDTVKNQCTITNGEGGDDDSRIIHNRERITHKRYKNIKHSISINYKGGNCSDVLPLKAARRNIISNLTFFGLQI